MSTSGGVIASANPFAAALKAIRPVGAGYGYASDGVAAGAFQAGDLAGKTGPGSGAIAWANAQGFTTLILDPYNIWTVYGMATSANVGMYGNLGSTLQLGGFHGEKTTTIVQLAANAALPLTFINILTMTATGGTFTLSLSGIGATGNLTVNAGPVYPSAAVVQAALNALTGTTFNRVYLTGAVYTIELDPALPTATLLTVNTGALTGGTAVVSAPLTNPYYMLVDNATGGTNHTFFDFTMDGNAANQPASTAYEYGNLLLHDGNNQVAPQLNRVDSRGFKGSANIPPHETQGINFYQTNGGGMTDCEVDGQRSRSALGVGTNISTGPFVFLRCWFHDCLTSHNFSAYQGLTAPITFINCVSSGAGSGGAASSTSGVNINCEESAGTEGSGGEIIVINSTLFGSNRADMRFFLTSNPSRRSHRIINSVLYGSPVGVQCQGTQTNSPSFEGGTVVASMSAGLGPVTGSTDPFPDAGMAATYMPNGVIAESISRARGYINTAVTIPSGTSFAQMVVLQAGVPVNFLSFTAVAASVGTTHRWFALCDSNMVQLATTADDTGSGEWAAHIEKKLAIATIASGAAARFVPGYSGVYYYVCVQVATTPATIEGGGSANATSLALAPATAGTSTAALTTPPAFPFTFAAIVATGNKLNGRVTVS